MNIHHHHHPEIEHSHSLSLDTLNSPTILCLANSIGLFVSLRSGKYVRVLSLFPRTGYMNLYVVDPCPYYILKNVV